MTASSIRRLVSAAALVLVLAAPVTAQACPLCKYANEANQENEEVNRRPKAYMYSILFMLSMPATVLSTFSFGFYRVWKKHQLIVGDQPMPGDDLEV